MSTIIIALIIAGAVALSIRHYVKQKGSCGDCDCSCPVKDQINQAHTTK